MSTAKELFTTIDGEVMYAHMLHQTCFALYDSGEEVVRLLEDSDEQFFSLIYNMYLDAIALSFTRLLDRDKSLGQDNLSLFYLLERTELRTHKDYGKWLADLQAVRKRAQKFFDVRNKATGHLDVLVTLNRSSVTQPVFSRTDIVEVYELMAAWLNAVREGIGMQPYLYTHGIANFQYARPILSRLEEARKTLGTPVAPSNRPGPYS